MRLLVARALAARALLVAAALAATVTTVLLTSFVLYAEALPTAGVRAAVLESPPAERTLHLRASAGNNPELMADRDAAVRARFAEPIAGVALPVTGGGYATGQRLPEHLAAEGESAVVGFLPDLPSYAELIDGRWPEPVEAAEPVEVALPESVADQLGLVVGDQLELIDGRGTDREPAPVTVVARWRPTDPTDAYWRLLASPIEQGGVGPFVVHPAEFTARYQLLGHLEWLVEPDPAELAGASLVEFSEGARELSRQLTAHRDADPALGSSVRFSPLGVTDLAERLAVATVVNRSGLVLPAALLAVTAGYGLVLVARLLAEHRRGENALLRARGASRRQLVRLTAAEALLVVAPAGFLGAPLGAQLMLLADRLASDGTVAAAVTPASLLGPPLAWLVSAAAAAGCAAALALPAAGRGRYWVAEQQERSRPSRVATLQRAGLDVALVVLALLAWAQLRQYGSAVGPAGGSDGLGLGIDPLLVAAPVVGVLAATVLALRFLPLATRLGVRLADRGNSFPGLLGMWQADRRPHAGPVLLLVLAVATAVLAPAVANTWQQSQRDQAAQQVGADLRVEVSNPAAVAAGSLTADLPAEAGAIPVHRTNLALPEIGQVDLLALDIDQAPGVVQLRPDLVSGGPDRLFAELRNGRPELAGLPLPADAQRLLGRAQFTVPEPAEHTFESWAVGDLSLEEPEIIEVTEVLPTPLPDQLTLHVRGAAGTIRSLEIGQRESDDSGRLTGGMGIDEDGWVEFDVALPPEASALAGLGAGVTVGRWSTDLIPIRGADPVPVRWHWEELRVVDSTGAETLLELPSDWQIRERGSADGPEVERLADDSAVTVTFQPERDYPATVRFLLTAPAPSLSAIPVVVTPDVLAATGAEVGSSVKVTGGAGGISSVRIVGVVGTVPGTETGTGAMVDLAWMSTHQFLWERRTPTVTEWWVAGADPGVAATLEALSWTGLVHSRQAQAQRLLDDPFGVGMLLTLWGAAAAAGLLAAFGLVVDSRATAVRRRRELAVLYTLGTGPGRLARALVVEQTMLAGLGVAAGALVGAAVAATMGPSLVLTATGQVPIPEPLLVLSLGQLVAPMLVLLTAAVGLGALVARRARKEIAAGVLRIGED